MSIPLDSMVGELQMVSGVRQSTAPATAVLTAPRRAARGRAEDTLYVLADVTGGTSSGILAELIQRVSQLYWSTPGSVTAALRAAINAAGEWLMSRNVDTPVSDRQNGGLSCAVLHGASVFIGQAGPANAYVSHQGSLEQFPARDSDPLPPLGMSRSVEIRFAHADLQPGDVILLTDARAADRLPLDSIRSAITYVGSEQSLHNLERLTGNGDLIALVIEVVPSAAAVVAATASAASNQTVPAQPATQTTATPAPTPVARSTPLPATTAPRPAPAKSAPAAPVSAPRPIDRSEKTTAPRTESIGATFRAWLGALGHGMRRGAGSVGTAGQIMVQRTLPDPVTSQAQRRPTQRTLKFANELPVLAGIAIGIPVIVVLIFATIFIRTSTQAHVESLLIDTRNEIALAAQSTGPEVRTHWLNALSSAAEVLNLMPDNNAASDKLQQAQAEIDRIDNIVRVAPIKLWDFKSTGPFRLATQGFSLFVLDRSKNQIDRVTLNSAVDGIEGGGPATVFQAGTLIGSKAPGDLLDMEWMNSSEKHPASNLIVLHRSGLIEYTLSFGLKPTDFGANVVPANARRMRSFNGNLYLLDGTANQIWRYSPTSDGYSSNPEAYFKQTPANPGKAIDMVIDGSIYIILPDGQINKYLGGDPDKFQIVGLSKPFGQPTAAAVDAKATASSLYVADRANQRIVQLRPDGQFLRDFRATGPAFNAVDDLLIDEQNGRLFVIGGGVLYTVQLPPLTAQP